MAKTNTLSQLINLSDMDPNWNWLADAVTSPDITWKHFSSRSQKVPSFIPKNESIARMLTAKKSISFAKKAPSLLISHAPRPTYYGAKFASLLHPNLDQLAISFTFTTLPTGTQHKLMAKAYQHIDRFLLYSTMEKKLYADYFDLDESKFDMVHWPIKPPSIEAVGEPIEKGDYICAIGSQGRDYAVLFKAMERLKHIKLVVVVHPSNIEGLSIPDNVKVYTNIPLSECNNIVHYSQFMVLPLIHDKVPCGHGSIVSAMFYKKAILITDAITVKDYIKQDETGRFFTHQDNLSLSREIESLLESPDDIVRLANNGYEFAQEHCTEEVIADYFRDYLASKYDMHL